MESQPEHVLRPPISDRIFRQTKKKATSVRPIKIAVSSHTAPSDRALKEIADDEVVMGSRQNTWQPAKWIRGVRQGKEMAGENVGQHAAISLGHSDS